MAESSTDANIPETSLPAAGDTLASGDGVETPATNEPLVRVMRTETATADEPMATPPVPEVFLVSGEPEEDLPEILREPTARVGVPFQTFFAIASILTGLCNVTIKQLLLPVQAGILDPTNKFTTFALIASIGALAGVIMAPLSGALSDRTVSRFGRRRPWIVIGLILAIIGLITMAQATSVAVLLVGEIIVQVAVDTVLSVITAIIPDQIPRSQRATASAFVGMSPVVGGLVGLLLVTRLSDPTHNPTRSYYVLAIASVIIIGLFLIVLRDKPLTKGVMPAFNFKDFMAGFWINPRKYPDFGLTLFSRCMIFLGYTILVSYILFYLQDVIHFQGADKGVTIFQVVSTLTLLVFALIGGIMADRLQRLKPFVSGAALVMMVAMLIISIFPVWPAMIAAAVVLGIGLGVYLAVDIALAVRVLPAASNRAKDLGIINTAIFLPLIFSPIIGALVLNTTHSYAILFGIAAFTFLLAAISIIPIKSVR